MVSLPLTNWPDWVSILIMEQCQEREKPDFPADWKPGPEKPKPSYQLVNFKVDFSERELKFLDLIFEGKTTPEKAVYTAGWRDCSQRHRYTIARQIIKKYEERAGGARNIFRDIGFGELTVAGHIYKLANKANSEQVKLRACELAAKALGMLSEEQEGAAGVQIVIQATGNSATQVNVTAPGPAPADPGSTVTVSYQHPAGEPGKPVQITK